MPPLFERPAGRLLAFGATMLLTAGCGQKLWPTLVAPVPSPVSAALRCSATQARTLGYHPSKFDSTAKRFSAARGDSVAVGHPAPEFDRVDVLVVEAKPAPGDATHSSLSVEARSYSKQMTRRGPTDVEEFARPQVKRDAETVIRSCSAV